MDWRPEEPKPAAEMDDLPILITRFGKQPVEQTACA
jgi:hypothetical protein